MNYLEEYLKYITCNRNKQLSEAIKGTADYIIPQYVSNFSFIEHVTSLLVGDVQSGKTSHMFGIMCAAANEGFGIFVLLTTDNVILQQQTFRRAKLDLANFCVCDENDYLSFEKNNMKKPVVVVLKKNGSVLKQWKNNFSSTNFCMGNPLFIVDDEADAASLNTLVNAKKQSTINRILSEIKQTTSSSIYMQVTGTPQAILLQSFESSWRPYFTYYFKPGNGYLGGDFFFEPEKSPHIIFTDNNEVQRISIDDEFPENGLKLALITHLISSAHILLSGGMVSNFLVHPSMKIEQHIIFAEKVGEYLNEINMASEEQETVEAFKLVHDDLKQTKDTLLPFPELYAYVCRQLENDDIGVLVLNSISSYDKNMQYETGINIIIGGNSLGRGITIPQLQTIYYCRVVKNPQADTMWQHARMFGYDRDPELIRLFIPPVLYKLFSDINTTNNSIIAQIKKCGVENIKMLYPKGLKPTRTNVLDKKTVEFYSGGVNYFPFYAQNKDVGIIDKILEPFSEQIYSVSLNLIANILEQCDSEMDDWSGEVYSGFVKSFIAKNPLAQGRLIVRRERDISRGTGTLLSPNDRNLGDAINDEIVLTMYKITGTKGWEGEKLWIPNIKLPRDAIYYSVKR